MRKLLPLILIAFISTGSASSQVVINEVGYSGVDFQGSSNWVELWNTGSAAIDVSTYWLCNYPQYREISSLDVLDGSTTIPAGGSLVVEFTELGEGDGEIGLYTNNDFGDSNDIVDYMQYGSAGHTRESVAVSAGVWDANTFVPAAAANESLALTGGGMTTAEAWSSSDPTPGSGNPLDPATAPNVEIDRFASGTGTLFVRDESNGLPDSGEPIDFDQAPFITTGLGPDGQAVQYYNFDVMPRDTAPIYVLFREGESAPVEGQANIVDVIPGDDAYNDFWHVLKVTVPSEYVANTVTSLDEISAAGFPVEETGMLVNCPIVPEGSTAELRLNSSNPTGLVQGWYRNQVIYYFEFSEKSLAVSPPDEGVAEMPTSPIFVAFNINPGEDGGGPASGFMTEAGSDQTHNVVATIPSDDAYSPLWLVNAYDNAEFDQVTDLSSASSATIVASGAALVNCPIVMVATNTAVDPVDTSRPMDFVLEGNYPNPFNPRTTIRYSLDEPGSVRLSVYDMLGREVVNIVNAPQSAGTYDAVWNGRDASGRQVSSGTYMYRLTLNGRSGETRMMTVLK